MKYVHVQKVVINTLRMMMYWIGFLLWYFGASMSLLIFTSSFGCVVIPLVIIKVWLLDHSRCPRSFLSLFIIPRSFTSHRINTKIICDLSQSVYAIRRWVHHPSDDKVDMDCALFSHLSPALEIYGVCWTLPRWLEPLKLRAYTTTALFYTNDSIKRRTTDAVIATTRRSIYHIHTL